MARRTPAPAPGAAPAPVEAGLPAASLSALRAPAVRRLQGLRREGKPITRQVRVVAEALGVKERAVWRWLADAERDGAGVVVTGPRERASTRFTVTAEVRHLFALWKGNVAAVHRELVARAARQSPPGYVPSLPTLHRAIQRDLDPGERAGLAAGERAARKHDVFLARPRGWRNQVWETDHVQAPVLVDVEGAARRPWITWFTDCATNAITGLAVTPGYPSRESVLAALRSAVLREAPYGPFGGLPDKVRMDRGKDFLSTMVKAVFDVLDVGVEDLPAYTPHLKGTVEGLNRAVESMFLAALPGYARQPRPGKRPSRPRDEVLLDFQDFTARLLDWVQWWNTSHRPAPLGGKTPLEAWQAGPTPLRDVPAADLWTFTLEDAGTRILTTRGIRFRLAPPHADLAPPPCRSRRGWGCEICTPSPSFYFSLFSLSPRGRR
ncbi:transposase family protein [Streptomyces sioyaensis]|uniref:transposase family protein n=1 Tax=Streptomyces sioyaensis TaxID=67364 RepID=UPI0036E370C5